MNYKGIIIEESLEDKSVLGSVKVLTTSFEQVDEKHKTPWIKQWTLHTVEIEQDRVEAIANQLSNDLDSQHPWYADFKNETTHFIIFRNKIFKVDRNKKEQYKAATDYGILLGIPDYQLDFSSNIK